MKRNNQQIIKNYTKIEKEIHLLYSNSIEDNKKKNKLLIIFSAETTISKDKLEKEIKYLQECMTETKVKKSEIIEIQNISIIVQMYKKDNYI